MKSEALRKQYLKMACFGNKNRSRGVELANILVVTSQGLRSLRSFGPAYAVATRLVVPTS